MKRYEIVIDEIEKAYLQQKIIEIRKNENCNANFVLSSIEHKIDFAKEIEK
jgi:hypothetical protein